MDKTRWRWKEEDKSFEIGRNFLIAPPWKQTEKYRITLTEGVSFGTGVHETTVSCIELMETLDLKNKSVLDIGIGSGILSIAAAMLGAKRVVGFDIDEGAIRECKENARINGVEFIECFLADSPKGIKESFYLVLANIFFDIILSMAQEIARLTAPTGFAILSGIVMEEEYSVKSTFSKLGFKPVKTLYGEDYLTTLLKKVEKA